ncbi:MAG: hypothetical protein M3066_12255 [Actinomycetota bacterium]|nr:hypothetical protein [Actinomycetota bacterium]
MTSATLPPALDAAAAEQPAPPTTGRPGPFCGFVPGSIIDIDLNGQPSGRQLADAKGCVTVTR